jgi:hypothetical protein
MIENARYSNYITLAETPPLKKTINTLSDGFKGLATEIGCADKYAAMIVKMPSYKKFQELTNGIQTSLRFTANFWQTKVKNGLNDVLGEIDKFLVSYEDRYSMVEENLLNIRNLDTEKELLINYLQEILSHADSVRSKILWVQVTDLTIFSEMVEGWGRKLKNEAIPAIQKAIHVTDRKIIDTQGKLADVKQLINANEKLLLDLSIGTASSALGILLGVGAILLGGFIGGGILLLGAIVGLTATAAISAKVNRELKEQKNQEQQFINQLNELNSESLYLKTMESDFTAVAGQTSQVIASFNNLMTGWENILNSLQQLQSKLKTVSGKLQSDELRYIRGAFRDAHLEFLTMKQKIIQYGMVTRLPVVDQVSTSSRVMRAAPYSLFCTPIPNELYFNYQSLAMPNEAEKADLVVKP